MEEQKDFPGNELLLELCDQEDEEHLLEYFIAHRRTHG